MLPSSNVRANANANANGILTREKATSISKTMSKFYKKPKLAPVVVTEPEPEPEPELEPEYSVSPKKELHIKDKKDIKKRKEIKDKKQKEESSDTEELNYIGDKEDLKNLDFLFREATGYEIGDEKDTDGSKSDSDEMGEVEKREKREKGEKYEKHPKILYPFSHKYSPHFSQDYKDQDQDQDRKDTLVEFLIYRVNKHAYKPFLEFMLYKADNTFYLPNLMCNHNSNFEYDSDSNSDSDSDSDGASDGASGNDSNRGSDGGARGGMKNKNIYNKVVSTLDTIFVDGNYKIKGRLIPSKYMNSIDETYLSERYILFVECILHDIETETETQTEDNTSTQYIPKETKLWWVTISEIFNYKKVLFYPVHDSVVNLFYSYPEMMNIFMRGKLLEIPIVVYNGNNDKYTKYNAIFSLKKAPQFSRYGPFYYFTDFHSSFKYACYDVDGDMQKFERGGLLRMILFPQKIKMFLERDKIDDSIMAHYLFEKYPEKIFTGQFRDNDNKWVKRYNTAYNGEYMITYDGDKFVEEDHELREENDENYKKNENMRNRRNIEKKQFPVMFCVSAYNQQQVISYHYVDTKGIPDSYSYEFKDYTLL